MTELLVSKSMLFFKIKLKDFQRCLNAFLILFCKTRLDLASRTVVCFPYKLVCYCVFFVGYIPNCSLAVEAMLATSSIGAIWSSTSPDFGVSVSYHNLLIESS